MPRRQLRIRHALPVAAVVLATVAGLLSAAVADARPALRCKSADLRYPFEAGGPKTFGVFKLRITGGRCTTAHRVAKTWMKRFEANLRARSRQASPHGGWFRLHDVAGERGPDVPGARAQGDHDDPLRLPGAERLTADGSRRRERSDVFSRGGRLGLLRGATEDWSTGVTVLVQVTTFAVIVGVVVILARRFR